MEWKYVEPLKKPKAVKEFLKKQGLELPQTLVEFIVQHNAGRPKKNCFDTNKSRECVFDGVFSYNEDDTENIYGIYAGELKDRLKKSKLFPIGLEPSGDLICVDLGDKNQLKLYRMESGEVEFIAETIEVLTNKLY